jgi:hypothetical protein
MLIYNLNCGEDYLFYFKIIYNTYIQSTPLSLPYQILILEW